MELVATAAQQPSSGDWSDRIVPILIVIVLLVLAILIGYTNYQNARPFRIESSTSLPGPEALEAIQAQLARDGWRLGHRDANRLIMNIDETAGLITTAALGILSVWLALVNFVSSRRVVVLEFETYSTAAGTTIITRGSRSGAALVYIGKQLRSLPKG